MGDKGAQTETGGASSTAASERDEVLSSLRSALACTPLDAQTIAAEGIAGVLPDQQRRHWLIERASLQGWEIVTCVDNPQQRWYRQTPRLDGTYSLSELVEILESRQSAINPIRAKGAVLDDLLHLLSLRRRVGEDAVGRKWESRYYPSAGGTHCIEPLLYVHDAEGHRRGWFCQVGPMSTDLRAIKLPEAETLIDTLMAALRLTSPPSAAIFAVADPELLLARYRLGASLLWRDAGAFLGIAQLCCSLLGLSSSIAGIAYELPELSAPIPPYIVGALGIGGKGSG